MYVSVFSLPSLNVTHHFFFSFRPFVQVAPAFDGGVPPVLASSAPSSIDSAESVTCLVILEIFRQAQNPWEGQWLYRARSPILNNPSEGRCPPARRRVGDHTMLGSNGLPSLQRVVFAPPPRGPPLQRVGQLTPGFFNTPQGSPRR